MFWYGIGVVALMILFIVASLSTDLSPKQKIVSTLLYLYVLGYAASSAFLLK